MTQLENMTRVPTGAEILAGRSLCFIGAGQMAQAMVAGLINGGSLTPDRIAMTNRNNDQELTAAAERWQVKISRRKDQVVPGADLVVLAVKPQDMSRAVAETRPLLSPTGMIVSVAAGITLTQLEALFGNSVPIVRAMPNSSSRVLESATVLSMGAKCTVDHCALAKSLFTPIGTVSIISEDGLDAVTGLSGSGPAYVYRFVQALSQAGQEMGLTPELSRQLTLQTLIGAVRMLQETGLDPEALTRQVMSPGGTTQAGLEALEEAGFSRSVAAAIRRATQRAGELSGSGGQALASGSD